MYATIFNKRLFFCLNLHAKILTFLVVCFVSGQKLLAQTANDSLRLDIYLFDSFSEDRISGAKVSVYTADGITLLEDSLNVSYLITNSSEGRTKTPYGYKGMFPKEAVGYMIKVSATGYDEREEYVALPKKKSLKQFGKDIYLFKSTIKDLGEASVTASKILMVNKGDTIVYNATAFRMAEGSMLDNLVRALPGAQIDDNGRITVNGEFVSSLLVNGRDFFKGDPKVALSNLPAYAVSKIKVFHRNDSGRDNSKRTEEEKKRNPLVMDVNLKRQYSQGWLANFEVAGGSSLKGGFNEVWLARLFAMRFTNHSSLAFFGNANNMNDYDAPASKGEWRKPNVGTGEKNTQMGGVSFSIDGKKTKTKITTELQAMHQTIDNEQRTTSVNYLPSGDISGTSMNRNHSGTSNIKWNASLDLPYRYVPDINMDAYFTHSAVSDTMHLAQYEGSGEGECGYLPLDKLYDRSQHGNSTTNNYGGSVSLQDHFGLGSENGPSQSLNYHATARYNHLSYNALRSDRLDYTASSDDNIHELKDDSQPSRDYSYRINANYQIYQREKYENRFLFSYQYSQAFRSGSRSLLRLDQLTTVEDSLYLGSALPSMRTPSAWMPDVKEQLSYDNACARAPVQS